MFLRGYIEDVANLGTIHNKLIFNSISMRKKKWKTTKKALKSLIKIKEVEIGL